MDRRELLKLGTITLMAPLARRIPDLELPQHPLLSLVHKDISPLWQDMPDDYVHSSMLRHAYPPVRRDIPMHGGMHDREEIIGIDCIPPGNLSLAMFWTRYKVCVTCDGGDTWERIAILDPHMQELQRNLVLRGLAMSLAKKYNQEGNHALEVGTQHS